jgi:hypothetical protein
VRWVIDIEATVDAENLPMVQHTVETAVDFVTEALHDLEVEAGVEGRLAS